MKYSCFIFLFIVSLFSQTYVSGIINGETWDSNNSPFIQNGDIIVYSLNIGPGVTVMSSMDYNFDVYGQINALGTLQDSIRFKPIEGHENWNGIKLTDTGLASRFEYCNMSSAWAGAINCINAYDVSLINCTITNSELHGVSFSGAEFIINGCKLYNNGSRGIVLSNAIGQIYNCVIYGNQDGIMATVNATIEIINCTISDNISNGIISNGGTNLITVLNSIIYYNPVHDNGGDIEISYSDVEGGFDGEGNFSYHPLFQEFEYYTLTSISPCVDAGSIDDVYNDVCFPPSYSTQRNDMGAFGGPNACSWLISTEYDNLGCTDPSALNFNPEATMDDGSCEYPLDVYGCTYFDALNFNPEATLDNGSCLFLDGDLDGSGDLNVLDVVILVETILSED